MLGRATGFLTVESSTTMCSRGGSCQLSGKRWKEEGERANAKRRASLMSVETAGGLVLMDWRRQCLYHGKIYIII